MEIIQVDIENSMDSFIEQFMDRIEDHTVLIFTADEETMIQNIIAHKSGVSTADIRRGNIPPDKLSRYNKATAWFRGTNLYFSIFRYSSLEMTKEEIDRSLEATTPDVVFVDSSDLEDETLDYIESYLDQWETS